MRLATDLPIWENPPFAKLLPDWAVVRRGRFSEDEDEMLIIGTADCGKHVDCYLRDEHDLDNPDRIIIPMINGLKQAVLIN